MLEMDKRVIYHSLGLECLQDFDKKTLNEAVHFLSFCLSQLQNTVFHKLDILFLCETWKLHNAKACLNSEFARGEILHLPNEPLKIIF